MRLKQLHTLVAIADTGSFHAAAAKLGLTQAAVSMQMKSLEESLRLELFERSVRPPRLNNTGLLMLEQAREITSLCDKLLDASPVSSQLTGSIRIGTVPGMSFILPQTLDNLHQTYRRLQVRVVSDLADELVHQIDQGRLDAAVITQPQDLNPQLLSRPLLSEPLMVIAHRDYSGQSDAELLTGNPYIGFNRKAEVSRLIEQALNQRNFKVDPIMELDTLETFQMMVLHGLGVGILPFSSIRKRFFDDLYVVPFGSPALQRTISLVQQREHHRQIFLDTLYDALSRVAADSRLKED
jgi:DNA-binding transcriptional LysR family regulator